MKKSGTAGVRARRRRTTWASQLLGLALALSITSLPAVSASAATPSTASSGGDVRLGRVDGENYVFDIPVTADLADMATCNPKKYAKFKDFCKTSTEEVGGTSYSVVKSQVSWDLDLIDRGTVAYSREGLVQGGWWQNLDTGASGWAASVAALREQATTSGTWKHVKLRVLTGAPAGADAVRLPIPATELARIRMVALAAQTTAGTYYPDVKTPADLAAYQQQMLEYANAGRRDPDWRKDNGSSYVLDLSKDEVQTKAGTREKVWRDSDTPPYFTDQRLTVELNRAAQFQAEYNAHLGLPSTPALHDGPAQFTYTDATGAVTTGTMTNVSDRSRFFGGPGNVVEGAGPTGPGDAPRNWMVSETHFRPFFNVDGSYPEVGFGAAWSEKAKTWYFIFVPRRDTEVAAKTLSEVELPAGDAVGVKGAEGDQAILRTSVTDPPPSATTGPVVDPAGGQAQATAASSTPSSSAPPSTATSTAPSTGPSSGVTCPPAGIADRKRDLYFGETWDPLGDGCFQITVEVQDEFVPSPQAKISGDPVEEYRGYRIRYDIRGTKTYDLSTIASLSCERTDGTGTLPLVLDPPGQGLPAAGKVGAGSATFSIGCGSGPDGHARVLVQLGQEQLGGGRVRWMHEN